MRIQKSEYRSQNIGVRIQKREGIAVLLSLVLFLFFSTTLMAQDGNGKQLFDDANTAYNNGDFEAAIDGYTKIEDMGQESAMLFFNKGNAYYKLKNYPMSILYYEKALALEPNNEDIKTNLQIANLTKVDKIDPLPQPIFQRWWESVKNSLAPNAWAWLTVALLALALAFLLVFFLSRVQALRKTGFFMSLVFIVAFVLSVVFAALSRHDSLTHDDAIIITPSVTMMSAPVRSGEELLVLHEGTKVKVIDKIDEWNKVRLADGNIGWIKAEDMSEF